MIKPLRPARGEVRPKLGTFEKYTHPFIIFVWKMIIERGVTLSSIAESAGVERSNIHKWRYNEKGPYLLQIEKVLNVLGYELKIVKKERKIK